MQIKIDENLLPDLQRLALLNRRTPTAEVNVALRHYIGANATDVAQAGKVKGKPKSAR